MGELTHFDAKGDAHMVDVGAKAQTKRIARARGEIHMAPATFALCAAGTAKKGDVIGVARIAAIMASKRTSELIPLCHPIALTHVSVDFELDEAKVIELKQKYRLDERVLRNMVLVYDRPEKISGKVKDLKDIAPQAQETAVKAE